MTRNADIVFKTEYIKNVLYFATVRQGKVLKSTADTHYFCIDNDLLYENYYSDFGPVNLACVYKYCKMLNDKLKLFLNKHVIVHYTSTESQKKANAAYLLGCFGILYLNLTPHQAVKPLMVNNQSYRAFQDASQGDSPFTISILNCLQGIAKAHNKGFFDFEDFNVDEYERLDNIQGGDLNWIVPGKFLAFIGPVECKVPLYNSPEMYVNYFLENNVGIVIRLNKKMYNESIFTDVGIQHYDLFFQDGSCPRKHILFKFLQIAEESNAAIAVHCKAGLGRTGTLIGCYLIKHYRMTAHEAIAWMRICRPGSVIGHQQRYLEEVEAWLIKQGNLYRKRMYQNIDKFPTHQFGIYSISEKLHKHRPVVFGTSPPSSPTTQRRTRSELPSTARLRTFQTREAARQTSQKEQHEWYLKIRNYQKSMNTGLSNKTCKFEPRQGNIIGAGEPRPVRPPTRTASPRPAGCGHTKTNDFNVKNIKYVSGYSQIPAFHSSHGQITRNTRGVKNISGQNSYHSEQQDKQLSTAIKVTPHNLCHIPIRISDYSPGGVFQLPSYVQDSVQNDQNQAQYRRRLGRSPSPPCTRVPSEQNRATNTPPPPCHIKSKESNFNIREALSKLKLSGPRSGSVGAASLGARRQAPLERRAPSVRSDERPLATQGDMLNSIKLQRRLRDNITFKTEKSCSISTDNRNSSLPMQSKATGSPWGIYSCPRPMSPKGRRSPQHF